MIFQEKQDWTMSDTVLVVGHLIETQAAGLDFTTFFHYLTFLMRSDSIASSK